MPKKVHEIKNLGGGTHLNADEKDISQESSSWALNVDANSREGVLQGVNTDLPIFRLNKGVGVSSGLFHGKSNIISNSRKINNSGYVLQDVRPFQDFSSCKIYVEGEKGVKEALEIESIKPYLHPYIVNPSLDNDNFYATWKSPAGGYTSNDTVFEFSSSEIGFGYDTPTADFITIHTGGTNPSNYTWNIKITILTDIATTKTALVGSSLTENSYKITTPGGTEKDYAFTLSGNTGSDTGGFVNININGCTTADHIATEISRAISSKNQWAAGVEQTGTASVGHGIEIDSTVDTNTATFTFQQKDLYDLVVSNSNGIASGMTKYFALYIDSLSLDSYGAGVEVIAIEAVDKPAGLASITVKRGCFGTVPYDIASNTKFKIMSQNLYMNKTMVPSNEGTFTISNWGNITGNNIKTSSTFEYGGRNHWFSATGFWNDQIYAINGRHNATNYPVTFDSKNKRIVAANIDWMSHSPGQRIHVYYTEGDSLNSGKTFTIQSLSNTGVMRVKEEVIDEVISSGYIYFEGGLIQNGSGVFSDASQNTSAGYGWTKKTLDWNADQGGLAGNQETVRQYSIKSSQNFTEIIATGGIGDDADNYLAQQGGNTYLYPFQSNKKVMRMTSTFKQVHQTKWVPTLSADALEYSPELTGGATPRNTYSAGDILKIESEYLRIDRVTDTKVELTRGLFGSSPASHTNQAVFKNLMSGISQVIPKEYLKKGTSYELTFWAKGYNTPNASHGFVAVSANNGYFNPNLKSFISEKNEDYGKYTLGGKSYFTKGRKWFAFSECDGYYGNTIENESGMGLNNVDSSFKKYCFKINMDMLTSFDTDLEIEFCSAGPTGSEVLIDYIMLSEDSKVYLENTTDRIDFTSVLDRKSIRDLITYNETSQRLEVFKNWSPGSDIPDLRHTGITYSPFTSENSQSPGGNFTAQQRNKELHIGYGAENSASRPQWVGYPGQMNFGEDHTDELYVDEDTVHPLSNKSSYTLDKICAAGEYEYQEATWDGTDLTITNVVPHRLKAGDNIVVREWGDYDNSWEGLGIWYVKATPTIYEVECRRHADDRTPNTPPRGERVSWRPYYWYGIRIGNPYIYRLTPSDRIKDDGSYDTSIYKKGLIERSQPLSFNPASITTCWNKFPDGGGGGKIYLMDESTESSNSVNIQTVDVNFSYDKWKTQELIITNSIYYFMPHYGYTHFNEELQNAAFSREVTDGQYSATCLTTTLIDYAGTPSDIMETKGTTYAFNPNALKPSDNPPNHFDTRLWISCQGNFGEGDRFLFCAHTNENTDSPSSSALYGCDRSPSTALTYVTALNGYGLTSSTNNDWLGLPDNELNVGDGTDPHNTFCRTEWGYDVNDQGLRYCTSNESSGSQTFRDWSWNSSDGGGNHINMGENIGWRSNSSFTTDVNITIPRFPMIAMADNDGDGIIDGTGLVTANTISLPDQYSTKGKERYGPYGIEGLRVSSHCVGLLGDGNGLYWIIKTGGWGPSRSAYEDDDDHGPCERLWGREGMLQRIRECLFTCPDIFAGDLVAGRSGSNNGTLQYERIQGGDMFGRKVFRGGSTGSVNFVGPSQIHGTDLQCFNAMVANIVRRWVEDYDGDDDSYEFVDSWSSSQSTHNNQKNYFSPSSDFSGVTTSEWRARYNGSEAAPGFYGKAWWTAPHQLTQQQSVKAGNYDDTDYGIHHDHQGFATQAGNYDSEESAGSGGHVGVGGDGYSNMPQTFRQDRLNFRAGVMIRPFRRHDATNDGNMHLNISNFADATIQQPAFPDAIFYTGSHDTIMPGIRFTQSQAAEADGAVPVTRTITIDNGSGGTYAGSLAELKEYLLGQYVWDSSKAVVGRITDIAADKSSVTFGEGLYRDITNGDSIYLDSTFTSSQSKVEKNKVFLIHRSETEDSPNEFTVKTFSLNHQAWSIDYLHSNYSGTIDRQMSEPYAVGTFAGSSSYQTSTAGNCDYKSLFPTYGALVLGASEFTGPNPSSDTVAFSYNVYKNPQGTIMPLGTDDGGDDSSHTVHPFKSKAFVSGGLGCHNKLVGNMIEIYDESQEVYHHRYIIASEWQITDGKLYLMLNYPLPSILSLTSSDTFKIYSHATACVPHIIMDNANFNGEEDKVFQGQSDVYSKVTYGGLDMRKTQLMRVINVDSSSTPAESDITVHPPGVHSFKVGDLVNLRITGDTANDILANVKAVAGDVITIDNAHTGNEDDNMGDIRMDNFEFVNTSRVDGTISETRIEIEPFKQSHDSVNVRAKWDTADVEPNLLASTASNKWVKDASPSSVTVTKSSTTHASNYFFKPDNNYQYKISCIYDGYQEGPLTSTYWEPTENLTATHDYLDINIQIAQYSRRLTSICLYRRDNAESFYRLVQEVSCAVPWGVGAEGQGTWEKTIRDTGPVYGTFESRTGMSETLEDIKVKYSFSEEIDGYLFIGGCSHDRIKDASNQIFRSKPGKFSIFDWTTDFIILKTPPTCMANFNGKLYVFDANNIYRINPHSLQIEDVYEGIGCLNQDSVIVTELGMYFANNTGAYFHNGQNPICISKPIWKGELDSNWENNNKMFDISWSNLTKESSLKSLKVAFNSGNETVLYFISTELYDSTLDKNVLKNYIWSFDIKKTRWDLLELFEEQNVGVPFRGKEGQVYVPINETIYELGAGNFKKPFTFVSKELTLGEDSIMKVYNKIKVNGLNTPIDSNLTNSEGLILKTSTGSIPSDTGIAYVDKIQDSEYKLKGPNKKGRWIKIMLENITDKIDSIGVIYRRKTTK